MENSDNKSGKSNENAPQNMSRRSVLVSMAALGAGALLSATNLRASEVPAKKKNTTKIHDGISVLGLGAGPVMWPDRNNTGFILTVNGDEYMIDCGAGTPQSIYDLGGDFTSLKHLFFTHYHFDHYAGYYDLLARGYQTYPKKLKSLDVWGPPGLKEITDGLMAGHKIGFQLHNWNPKWPNLPPTPTVHEFDLPQRGNLKVYEDKNVIVTTTRVTHGPDVPDACCYRFDIKSGAAAGKSVLFSGDTTKNDQLIALAKDVTVLVHEVGIDAFAEKIAPKGSPLYVHLLNSHTDVSQIPVIAKEANAGTVVLHHYGNVGPRFNLSQAANLVRNMVVEENKKVGYEGKIVAPLELDIIEIG